MTTGLQRQGATFVRPFTAPLKDMLWYQTTVLETLRDTWTHPILDEHGRCFDAFVEAARGLEDDG